MCGADHHQEGARGERAVQLVLSAALIGLATATTVAQFARYAWVGETASHFRAQYLLALVIVASAFLAWRRWAPALVAAVFALPNLWYVCPYLLPHVIQPSPPAPSSLETRVISLNLQHRNVRYEDVRRYLAASDADVVALSELTPRWMRELRPVMERYPHWLSLDRPTAWGLGVFSKYPLDDARWTDLGVRGSSNLLAKLRLPGGEVMFGAVHLVSPTTPYRARQRDRQLQMLAGLLRASEPAGIPRLLVGDLNATVFSPALRDFLEVTGMVDGWREFGLLGTWPVRWPVAQIQIDHALRDPGLEMTRLSRGPDVGSDHYPLEIGLRRSG